MNRHQRRAAQKAQELKKSETRPEDANPPAPLASPRLSLRIAAAVLLSPWVLRRVRNPQVLGMLREVAKQAGRDAVAQQLGERMNASR